MKNIFPIILISLFVFVSCKKTNVKNAVDISAIDTLQSNLVEVNEETIMENDTTLFDMLMITSYRIYEGQNPLAKLDNNWLDLYKQNGEFYIKKVDYSIENGYDECSGDSLKIINSSRKSLFFMDYKDVREGKLNKALFKEIDLQVGVKTKVSFNNTNYELKVEGIQDSSNSKNYKIILIDENKNEEVIAFEESMTDTYYKLIFAGDIDKDGKLDLIFEAPRHYEEKRIIILLSSKASPGKKLRKASDISESFDC